VNNLPEAAAPRHIGQSQASESNAPTTRLSHPKVPKIKLEVHGDTDEKAQKWHLLTGQV